MLNVTQIRGSNQYAVAHYFSSADDYYTKEEHGHWQGKGAAALGLSGAVDQAEFSRLLGGILPNGERIYCTRKDDTTRRMGIDFTFSAPKSVSLQALIAGDKGVTVAHDRAVSFALEELEKLTSARRKEKGKSYRERTGNLVIAKFRHEMSRAKDPQLHTHAVALNMTQRKDGKWRALSNEDFYLVQHELDALYKGELAKELQALGYRIRLTDDKGNFELGNISRKQIEMFSARSKVIEDALAKDGKTRKTATTLEKQIIALATRPRKDERDRELVKEWWITKSREAGIRFEKEYMPDALPGGGIPAFDDLPQHMTPAQAVVQYAIRHMTEREAVVTENQLMAAALQRAVGLATYREIKAEIQRKVAQGALIPSAPSYGLADRSQGTQVLTATGWKSYLRESQSWSDKQAARYVASAIKRGSLVKIGKRYTTQQALKREKAILAIERDGRGKMEPVINAKAAQDALEHTSMNPGQKAAALMMVSSRNRFMGIQGDAGTGKTYTVNQAVEMIKHAISGDGKTWRTVALAPYGNQVKALKEEGLEAHTLAGFLRTKEKPIDEHTIILLDEGGVTGARQMEQAMRIVERHNARMVILGDTKQTEAIEAGKPFAQLQQEGMETVRIEEIQRQQPKELKQSVCLAARGSMQASLEKAGMIEEHIDAHKRHQRLVESYLELPVTERTSTLIISGTNEARREINSMMRVGLDLAGQGKPFTLLTRVDMSQAQRRYAPSYQRGMVIQPDKDYPRAGLVRGESYHVQQALPGNVLVLHDAAGEELHINPRTSNQLSVYQAGKAELAVGDTVRINRNNPALDLTNGDRMSVTGIIGQTIRLEAIGKGHMQPRVVELEGRKPLHLEYAYASTVHSAQGLTNDRVFIDLDTKSRTTSMNLYYVAISRARYEARIFTDKQSALPSAISRHFTKTTALELQREKQPLQVAKIAAQYGKKDGAGKSKQLLPEKQTDKAVYGGDFG